MSKQTIHSREAALDALRRVVEQVRAGEEPYELTSTSSDAIYEQYYDGDRRGGHIHILENSRERQLSARCRSR